MASNSTGFIGRRESIGVGIETTNGTAVAAQAWQPHLSLTLNPKTNTVENDSALGRYEQVNDSMIAEQWAEGSIEGKIHSQTIGYFLLNMFGQVATAAHAGETAVKDHTFTVAQSGTVPGLTFTRINPVETSQYAYGVLSDLEIDVKVGDWVQFTATFQSKTGATTTATAAYATNEYEFTSKDCAISFANSVAGLTSATPADIKSLKFKISRKLERNTPLGSADPSAFDIDSYTFSGTIVSRYTDTVLKNIALANTPQAMQISMVNKAVTIGTSTKPGLVFTLPKVRLDPQTLSNNLDQVLQQTFNFSGQLDVTVGYACNALLTNTATGYVRA